MKKVYHHYKKWEDYQHGMFANEKIDVLRVIQSEELLIRPRNLYERMTEVSVKWEKAAELNLTNFSRNRQAWLGQASCCLNHKATDTETKLAWHNISYDQKLAANKIADKVLKEWIVYYKEICQKSTQTKMF